MSKYQTYKHPSGIRCLSLLGYMQKEAVEKGRKVHELIDEVINDLKTDKQKTIDYHKSQQGKNDLLGAMKDLGGNYPEEYPEVPTKIIEIIDVKYDLKFGGHRLEIICMAEFPSGIKKLQYTNYYAMGTYTDPPEQEEDFEEIE